MTGPRSATSQGPLPRSRVVGRRAGLERRGGGALVRIVRIGPGYCGAGPVESAATASPRFVNWLSSREAPPLLTCPHANPAPHRKFRWRIADRAELIAARAARARWLGAEPKPCRAAP